MAKKMFCTNVVFIMLLLPGCGGGGTGNAVPLPVNTAIVLTANGQASAPIKVIDVKFVIPQAATPILNPDGTLQINDTGLRSMKSNGFIPAGSYNPVTREVRFSLFPNSIEETDLGTGDVARLTVDITPGAQLSAQDISPVFDAFGSGSAVVTGIVPTVRIVTYQKP